MQGRCRDDAGMQSGFQRHRLGKVGVIRREEALAQLLEQGPPFRPNFGLPRIAWRASLSGQLEGHAGTAPRDLPESL